MAPLEQQLHEFALTVSTGTDDLELSCQRRSSLLHAILDVECPLQLLQPFVSKWRSWLTTLKDSDSPFVANSASIILVCGEWLQLAQTLQRMAQFQDTRSTLHQCLVLSRDAAAAANQHGYEHNALLTVRNEAKQALLECIRLQDALSECMSLVVTRAHAPAEVLTHALKQIDSILPKAPFAVTIMRIKVNILMQMQQYKPVVNTLSACSFTHLDAELTLAYARALEITGFSARSMNAARVFLATNAVEHGFTEIADESMLRSIRLHCIRLVRLRDSTQQADEHYHKARYDSAESCIADCLELVNPLSLKDIAGLLLDRANVRVACDRLDAAIQDLRESWRRDPSNHLTKLRLQTLEMQVETERLRARLTKR